MAKRFTDTNKWKKGFIRDLDSAYKLLWLYILDDCDHAGVWIVDWAVARIKIGEEVEEGKALELFGDKVRVIDGGERWFIQDFIDFQYGKLNPDNRAHKSVIDTLEKYKIKPLISPLQGAKDKDKDKDKEKDKEKKNADDFFEFDSIFGDRTILDIQKQYPDRGYNEIKNYAKEYYFMSKTAGERKSVAQMRMSFQVWLRKQAVKTIKID